MDGHTRGRFVRAFGRVENVRILDLTDARSRMGHFYYQTCLSSFGWKMVHLIVYEFFVPLDAFASLVTTF